MKKGLKILGVCLIIILNAVCFCSCSLTKDKTFVYDDYFVCYKRGNDNNGYKIAIVELTELGKEQEILIIPETINGLKVVSLGGYVPQLIYSDPRTFYSNKLRKLYIPFKIDFFNTGDMVCIPNTTIINFFEADEFKYRFASSNCKRQCFLFDPGIIDEETSSFNLIRTNCFFYKNDKVVWIDYIADGEVYALPDDLQIDWYYEPECINLWNGEYVIPDGQEQLNLYSK